MRMASVRDAGARCQQRAEAMVNASDAELPSAVRSAGLVTATCVAAGRATYL